MVMFDYKIPSHNLPTLHPPMRLNDPSEEWGYDIFGWCCWPWSWRNATLTFIVMLLTTLSLGYRFEALGLVIAISYSFTVTQTFNCSFTYVCLWWVKLVIGITWRFSFQRSSSAIREIIAMRQLPILGFYRRRTQPDSGCNSMWAYTVPRVVVLQMHIDSMDKFRLNESCFALCACLELIFVTDEKQTCDKGPRDSPLHLWSDVVVFVVPSGVVVVCDKEGAWAQVWLSMSLDID